jgi:hypothetical protein
MIFRALDDNGDWTFGDGHGDYLEGSKAIDTNVRTALYIFRGECFWNLTFGIDWLNLIGAKNPQATQQIILQCRQMITTRYGVTRINSVTSEFGDFRRRLRVTYNIDTLFDRNYASALVTRLPDFSPDDFSGEDFFT